MLADQAGGKYPLVDKTHQERPRDVQEVGGLLRGHLGFDGNERDGIAGGGFAQQVDEQPRHDWGQIKGRFVAGCVDLNMQGFIERFTVFERSSCRLGKQGVLVGGNNRITVMAEA